MLYFQGCKESQHFHDQSGPIETGRLWHLKGSGITFADGRNGRKVDYVIINIFYQVYLLNTSLLCKVPHNFNSLPSLYSFFSLCDKVYHKQKVCFLFYLPGQIVHLTNHEAAIKNIILKN